MCVRLTRDRMAHWPRGGNRSPPRISGMFYMCSFCMWCMLGTHVPGYACSTRPRSADGPRYGWAARYDDVDKLGHKAETMWADTGQWRRDVRGHCDDPAYPPGVQSALVTCMAADDAASWRPGDKRRGARHPCVVGTTRRVAIGLRRRPHPVRCLE